METQTADGSDQSDICIDCTGSSDPATIARYKTILALAAETPRATGSDAVENCHNAVLVLGELLEGAIRAAWHASIANLVDYSEARSAMLQHLAWGEPLISGGKSRKSLHDCWNPEKASLQGFAAFCATRRFGEWRRHLAARREVQLEPGKTGMSGDTTLLLSEGSHAFPPDRQVYGRQIWAAVQVAMADLTPKRRQALQLNIFDGLEPKKVASVMGIGHSAANNLIARGKAQIQKMLEAQGFDTSNF